MGEAVVVIETPTAISRLEFSDPDTGNPFHISTVPAGTSLYKEALPVGRYCLTTYVVGLGDVGNVYTMNPPLCLDVTEGKTAYPGHLVFGADGTLTTRVDEQCLANQLAENSSLGSVSVTPCG